MSSTPRTEAIFPSVKDGLGSQYWEITPQFVLCAELERENAVLMSEVEALKKDKARLIEALWDCANYADWRTQYDVRRLLAAMVEGGAK